MMTFVSPSPAASLPAIADFAVDRSSPIPLYFQLAQHIEREIESGRIPNGALFENEIQLAEQFGLSRPTMRRAMQHLVDKGLIVRRRGIGTRVVQPKVRRPLELTSLYDDLAESGQSPTTAVIDLSHAEADETVAAQLDVPLGAEVLRVVRLRSAADNPIAKLTNYLPLALGDFTPEDLERTGLYDLMRTRGVRLHSATQVVGARNATAPEARLLGEPPRAAVLTMQRTSYNDLGAAVEYGDHIYASSRYSFHTNLLMP